MVNVGREVHSSSSSYIKKSGEPSKFYPQESTVTDINGTLRTYFKSILHAAAFLEAFDFYLLHFGRPRFTSLQF